MLLCRSLTMTCCRYHEGLSPEQGKTKELFHGTHSLCDPMKLRGQWDSDMVVIDGHCRVPMREVWHSQVTLR